MNLDYDLVLENIGQFGLWHIMVSLLASLAAMAASFTTFQVGNLETSLTRLFFFIYKKIANHCELFLFSVLIYWLFRLRICSMSGGYL